MSARSPKSIPSTASPVAWAVARNMGGVRRLAVGWNLLGIADFLVAVSMVSLSFIGVLSLQPAPVRIGLHPLADKATALL